MVEGVSRYLGSSDTERRVKNELSLAFESSLYFVDLSERFSMEMIAAFRLALQQHVSHVTRSDREDWANPELYNGYLDRLRELQQLLDTESGR